MRPPADTYVELPPVSRKWLYEQYITNGRGCPEIGDEIGRDAKTVLSYLKKYGIESRKRGYANPLPPPGKGELNHFYGKTHSDEFKERQRQARKISPNLPHLLGKPHWTVGLPPERMSRWKGGCTPERQSFYASLEWKEVVKKVWARSNAVCERCGKHHNTEESRGTFHIHHIVSFMFTPLRAALSNLVLLCKKCHLYVHSKANKDKEFLKEPPCQ